MRGLGWRYGGLGLRALARGERQGVFQGSTNSNTQLVHEHWSAPGRTPESNAVPDIGPLIMQNC